MGNRIKEVRKSRGITQKQLAELLGVTPQAVSQFEKADTERFTFSTLKSIADALECQVRDLIEPDIFPERYMSPSALEYVTRSSGLFFSMIRMTSDLNLIGNAALEEYARLLSECEKYTSEDIDYLKQVWDPAIVDKYYPLGGRDDLKDMKEHDDGRK